MNMQGGEESCVVWKGDKEGGPASIAAAGNGGTYNVRALVRKQLQDAEVRELSEGRDEALIGVVMK